MDDLNILLQAKLDEQKSVANINEQIKTIQDKLKNIGITLDVKNINSQLSSIVNNITQAATKANKAINNVGQKSQGKVPALSALEKHLNEYTKQYKAKMLDVKKYIQQMESSMYKKDGSQKVAFDKLPEVVRLKYIKQLQTAREKDSADEIKKQQKIIALQNQYQAALQKSKIHI